MGLRISRKSNSQTYRVSPALSAGTAGLARADAAQVVVRIDSGAVTVAPVNSDRVIAHRFYSQNFQRGLVHLEGRRLSPRRAWGSAVRPGAAGTRALVPQVL